jgi:hypothetical protein
VIPSLVARYTRWLHTQWPAGTVEPLPEVREDGATAVSGLYVAGDLTGIPLLKFSADTGARVVADDRIRPRVPGPAPRTRNETFDLAIVGGGVAGMAAALEAKKLGLAFVVIESSRPFATIANFPVAKPIYTYPADMTPAGDLKVTAAVKSRSSPSSNRRPLPPESFP